MVRKESPAYLLTGHDAILKSSALKKIKEQFLKTSLEQFNLDTLYASELTLKTLQERLLCLPVKGEKRIVVIKESQSLKEEVKDFIVEYLKNPYSGVIFVLEADRYNARDEFFKAVAPFVNRRFFREEEVPDVFGLNRQIELKKATHSLRILKQLLEGGERPERILGGLRYVWEKDIRNSLELKKRMRLLLNCDVDIKTGRLNPAFALERFVIRLCGLKDSSG